MKKRQIVFIERLEERVPGDFFQRFIAILKVDPEQAAALFIAAMGRAHP